MLLGFFNHVILNAFPLIEESIRWADEKYSAVCNEKQTAVVILYLRGISVYRSLIVDDNGIQYRYDDSEMLLENYNDLKLLQNVIESLRRDGYIIIKKY